jgi:N-sulfoglucosamine sulfohydrolase
MRWILTLALLLPSAAPQSAPARPNVLFLTVDDMHGDSVGAFGCPIPGITPHIDRLAADGLRFRRGHVTIAICMPTRAVWMTGRYPHRSGALGFDNIRPDVPTVVEALKVAGYRTGLFAKEPHVVPSRHAAFDVLVKASELREGRDPAGYGAKAAAFFAQAKAEGKPFFLMANAQDPHRPFAKETDDVRRVIKPAEAVVPGFLPDLPDIRTELAQYFTSVHRADEVVGAVLAALDVAGLRESTLVLFLSDHGMSFPFSKTNCWVDSTRTPWIVRWPGVVKAGAEDVEHFVSGIDVAPTILEAAGLPSLEGADGRSIVPILKGGRQEGRERVYTHLNTTSGRNA